MKKVTSILLVITMMISSFAAFSQVGAISQTPEYVPNAGLVIVQSGAQVTASHNVAKLAKDNGVDTLAVVGASDNTASFKISATTLGDMAKAGMKIKVITPKATMLFAKASIKELSEKIKQEFAFSLDSNDGIKVTYLGDNAPVTLENGASVSGVLDSSDYNSVTAGGSPLALSYVDGTSWGFTVKEDVDAKFVTATAPAFNDVADNFWGKAAVDYVTSKGFFNGTGAGIFSPDAKMTRAMVVTVLSRIDGYNSDNITYTYTDTDKTAWFAKGVNWAFENGIVDGGDSFRPNDNVKRIELMDMLYRFALKLGITEEVTETDLGGFVDAARVTDEKLIKAAFYCTDNGVVTGKAAGDKIALAPMMEATRAEVATMIQRFMRNAILGAGTMSTNGQYKDFIKVRGNLNNLYNKLNSGEEVRIGYYGGSVTDGHGASSDLNSWRGRTFNWFKQSFPKTRLIQVKASEGGTGSHWGSFRIQRDLLSKNPDLVFIEFVVNDYYCQTQSDGNTTLYYEQVIRQIRESYPECDIISIFTTDSERAQKQKVAATELCTAAAAQDIVCEKYGVTSINVGGALTRTLEGLEGGISGNWAKYVLDTVHPLDVGYKVYADAIIEYLQEYLLGAPTYTYGETKAHSLPETYADERNATMKPEIYYTNNLEIFDSIEGFEIIENKLTPVSPDNKFTFTFTGTGIDLYMKKSIAFEYSLDGGEPQICVQHGDMPQRLLDGLEAGKHTITISIKGATSSGENLKPDHIITALLVEGIK